MHLASVRSLLAHAREHLDALNAAEQRYTEGDGHAAIHEVHDDGRRHLFRLKIAPPPSELAFIVGDLLHDVRSALDRIIYTMAVVGANGDPPRDQRRWYRFPITDIRAEFDEAVERMVAVPEQVVAELQRLQSFDGPMIDSVLPLYVLRDLVDSTHRESPIIGAWCAFSRFINAPGAKIASFIPLAGAVSDGTECEVTFVDPEVDVQLEFRVHPVLQTRNAADFWSADLPSVALGRTLTFIEGTIVPRFEGIT